MEGTIGVNIPEILRGIKRAHDIHENFFDPFNAAPEQIRLLVNTSKDAHDVLQESELLLRQCNRPYPGQDSFNKRLKETQTFIKRYCEWKDIPSDDMNDSPPRVRKTWKTFKYSWEDKKTKQLHNGLMIEMQKFIQFILVLAL